MRILCKYLFVFFLLGSSAFAADYGVVNFKDVLQKSAAFQSFQKQANSNKQAIEKALNDESASLKNTEQSLAQNRNSYSPNDFEKKRADFENRVKAFRKRFQDKQRNFENNNADAMKLIETKLQECVAQVANEKKLDIVYRAGALGFYDKKRDFSAEVLKLFNKKLPSVTLKKA
ncbi:OmpH family outer membrane protein [Candidatus Hepatincola sp. Pdp]